MECIICGSPSKVNICEDCFAEYGDEAHQIAKSAVRDVKQQKQAKTKKPKVKLSIGPQ